VASEHLVGRVVAFLLGLRRQNLLLVGSGVAGDSLGPQTRSSTPVEWDFDEIALSGMRDSLSNRRNVSSLSLEVFEKGSGG
jgi:hypothetical protein